MGSGVILIILLVAAVVVVCPMYGLIVLMNLKGNSERRFNYIEVKLREIARNQKKQKEELEPSKIQEQTITAYSKPETDFSTKEIKRSLESEVSSCPSPPPPPPLSKEKAKIIEPKREAVNIYPAKEPSEFEKNAVKIIDKIWMWIIVGENFRKDGVSTEYAVATTWLVRSAIIILLTGIAFFLKYSIAKGLLPPAGRVCIGIATGLVMLFAGLRLARKKYHLIGMGLVGGGIAALYFSIFVSANMYHLMDLTFAFAVMTLITFVAGVLSVRLNSLLVAILGVVGGYVTPVLLSSGVKNLEGLFGYLLLLGVGTLYIAKHKDWKLLNALSFIFTYALFFLSLDKFYEPGDFALVMSFLSLFFMLFSAQPIMHNILKRHKSTVFELFAMLANLSIFMIASYELMIERYDRCWFAVVSVSLAAFYILQIVFFLKKKLNDRNLLIMLSGFAAFCITITVPLMLSGEWITAAWAVQGLIFIWMSCKMRSNFIRLAAYLIYIVAFGRLMVFDFHGNFVGASGDYWNGLLARFASMGMLAVSLAGSCWLLKKDNSENEASFAGRENDIEETLQKSTAIKVFFGAAFAFFFVYLHFEFSNVSRCFYTPMRAPLLTSIWLGAIAFFLYKFKKTGSSFYIKTAAVFSVGLIWKLVFVDAPSWDFSRGFIYGGPYSFEAALMRFMDFIPAVALFGFALFVSMGKKAKDTAVVFGVMAGALFFAYLTVELNTFLSCYVADFRPGGISILWGIFALAAILTGILKNVSALRYVGLALFLVTALKVFFSDLSDLSQIYRIVAFVALGLVMLGGAFVYIKFKHVFGAENGKDD